MCYEATCRVLTCRPNYFSPKKSEQWWSSRQSCSPLTFRRPWDATEAPSFACHVQQNRLEVRIFSRARSQSVWSPDIRKSDGHVKTLLRLKGSLFLADFDGQIAGFGPGGRLCAITTAPTSARVTSDRRVVKMRARDGGSRSRSEPGKMRPWLRVVTTCVGGRSRLFGAV